MTFQPPPLISPHPLLVDYLALLLQKGAQQELTMATFYNAEVK